MPLDDVEDDESQTCPECFGTDGEHTADCALDDEDEDDDDLGLGDDDDDDPFDDDDDFDDDDPDDE